MDVALEGKREPGLSPRLPRYWVEAREVYLRSADLPKRLLTALRSARHRPSSCWPSHIYLFAHRLRYESPVDRRVRH